MPTRSHSTEVHHFREERTFMHCRVTPALSNQITEFGQKEYKNLYHQLKYFTAAAWFFFCLVHPPKALSPHSPLGAAERLKSMLLRALQRPQRPQLTFSPHKELAEEVIPRTWLVCSACKRCMTAGTCTCATRW